MDGVICVGGKHTRGVGEVMRLVPQSQLFQVLQTTKAPQAVHTVDTKGTQGGQNGEVFNPCWLYRKTQALQTAVSERVHIEVNKMKP